MSILSGYLGSIPIGGSGGVNLAKQGNYSAEVGTENTGTISACIDFHSANAPNDYDRRIISTGGSTVGNYGEGTLTATAGTVNIAATTGATGTITLRATIIKLNSSNTNSAQILFN